MTKFVKSARTSFIVVSFTLAVVQLWSLSVSAAELPADGKARCIFITESDGSLVAVCGKK